MKHILPILLLSTLAASAADLSGNWPGMLQTARGVDDHNLILRQSGGALAGTIAFSKGKWDIQDAKLDGGKLTFHIALAGSVPWLLYYELQVSGDEISGTVTSKQGPFSGGKVKFKRER